MRETTQPIWNVKRESVEKQWFLMKIIHFARRCINDFETRITSARCCRAKISRRLAYPVLSVRASVNTNRINRWYHIGHLCIAYLIDTTWEALLHVSIAESSAQSEGDLSSMRRTVKAGILTTRVHGLCEHGYSKSHGIEIAELHSCRQNRQVFASRVGLKAEKKEIATWTRPTLLNVNSSVTKSLNRVVHKRNILFADVSFVAYLSPI